MFKFTVVLSVFHTLGLVALIQALGGNANAEPFATFWWWFLAVVFVLGVAVDSSPRELGTNTRLPRYWGFGITIIGIALLCYHGWISGFVILTAWLLRLGKRAIDKTNQDEAQ